MKPAKSTVGEAKGVAEIPNRHPKPGQKVATFTLEALQANEVFVAGSFNDGDPRGIPLQYDGARVETRSMNLEPGEYEYRFVVDGVWWVTPRIRSGGGTSLGARTVFSPCGSRQASRA